ncbi:MAG: glycerate kinase [Firmicutes bacterium GWF2_51_9]|nr:MAG: glycerate kinase [Firmicutes bacterium GWF2_51_9]OGS58438.1 MAG: glycerate kinase [Firmicutes bacterium GWE2_51_13]HAM63402.1 glycerate kinase [Erysipelotrichaceae bacterium]HBZ40965.1 glycerate kinase [Erysipelotrichaceae bacterium]
MKRILCIPDSFKGTLSSAQIIHTVTTVMQKHLPEVQVLGIEVADGGEGSVDAFLSISGGEKIVCEVSGPRFERIESFYGILPGKIAVIEMASCAGLPLVKDHLDPLTTTTYGVGELMISAWEKGCRKMIVGLGGSSTNDGGCGAAAALGIEFFDEEGKSFVPTGGSLHRIAKIDASHPHPLIKGSEIITMCDIDNPMYGPQGAAYVFGPQKGADPANVLVLDQGLRHLAKRIEDDLKQDVSSIPGTGAAGGMGAGMVAFFHSSLQSGIETILDVAKFDELVQGCDLVITGEGRIDAQSLRGKVPIGVAKRAKKAGVPVLCIVGSIGEGLDEAYELGITSIFSINPQPLDFSIAKTRAVENLTITVENFARLFRVF